MKREASDGVKEPITGGWKISRVIQEYPALLDTIIASAPAFQRLRNPLVRRVQSRLVTVGQAADVAGVEPAALVQRLNAAAGLDVTDSTPAGPRQDSPARPEPPWVGNAPVAERLDVRPFQRRGEESFSAIMAAIRQVPRGQLLVLRNTFEPAPLYEVLGQRGFEHWARQLADDDWEILFYNTGLTRADRTPRPAPRDAAPQVWDEPTATLTIDVSELVPPEPMIRILTALEELPAGACLLVHHVRRPMHLYPRLDELGYRHETRDLGPGRVEVLIEKPLRLGGAA